MVIDDDADDEIVIKMPAAEKDEECSSEEDGDKDEDDDSESEDPSEEDAEAEWKSSLFYCGLCSLAVRVHIHTSGSCMVFDLFWESHENLELCLEITACLSVCGHHITFEKEALMRDSTIPVGITLVSTLAGACKIITMSLIYLWAAVVPGLLWQWPTGISVLEQAESFAMQGWNADTKHSKVIFAS